MNFRKGDYSVEKVWGNTTCQEDTHYYSRHYLELKSGGYCSVHYHKQRANQFRVISGKVRVVECYMDHMSGVDLTSDMVYIVPSKVVHQFQVLENGIMIEEYFPDRGGICENEDIVRLYAGGMMGGGICQYPGFILPGGRYWRGNMDV